MFLYVLSKIPIKIFYVIGRSKNSNKLLFKLNNCSKLNKPKKARRNMDDIDPSKTIVIALDCQRGFFRKHHTVYKSLSKFLSQPDLKIIATKFSGDAVSENNSSLMKRHRISFSKSRKPERLIPVLSKRSDVHVIEKSSYAPPVEEIVKEIKNISGDDKLSIVIVGADMDSIIFPTAFLLEQEGVDFKVASDLCINQSMSFSTPEYMKSNFINRFGQNIFVKSIDVGKNNKYPLKT